MNTSATATVATAITPFSSENTASSPRHDEVPDIDPEFLTRYRKEVEEDRERLAPPFFD